MAPKKKKRVTKKQKGIAKALLGIAEVKKLWTTISPGDWLALFQEVRPDLKFSMSNHTLIKCRCPYHEEATPSCNINFKKKFLKCFGCDKINMDLIDIFAKLQECSYTEAIIFIYTRFNLSDVLGTSVDDLNTYHRVAETKKLIAVASKKLLQAIIRKPDTPELSYCLPALEYLLKGRKIDREGLVDLPLGLYGKPLHLNEYIPDEWHLDVEKYLEDQQKMPYYGGILFWYNDTPGNISRFKLRRVNTRLAKDLNTPEQFEKLSFSQAQALISKDFVVFADEYYRESLGLYGIHKYSRLLGKSDTNCYITEGEFDIAGIMAAQDQKGTPDFMIMATGGKGATDFSMLAEYGVRTIWLVPDHPSKAGIKWVLSILRKKENFQALPGGTAFSIKVFTWPTEFRGFDLGEVMENQGYDTIVDILFRKRTSYFMNYIPWIRSLCNQELDLVKNKSQMALAELDTNDKSFGVASANLLDDKEKELQSIIIKYLEYVLVPLDKQSFVESYAIQESIDVSKLSKISSAMYALNTMPGVGKKISDAFEEKFSIAYYERQRHGNNIYAWSKEREEVVALPIRDTKMNDVISMYFGKTITEWFDLILGDNELYLNKCEDETALSATRIKRDNAAFMFSYALENIVHKAVNVGDLEVMAQGLHFKDLPGLITNPNTMYLVNGKKIFRGTYERDSGDLEWEKMSTIVADGVLFDNLSNQMRWSFVTDPSDLYAANQVDLNQTYENLITMLNGWKLQHHDVIVKYLACYIMSISIMRAIGDVNITYVTGESESGKTSLICGLLGGNHLNKHKIDSVLECAVMYNDASAAAMYQNMEGSGQLLVIDEAEVSKEHETDYDRRTQEIIRSLYSMPMGGVVVSRGGVTKDQRKDYMLRMPVLLGGINMPMDPTFLSRVLIVSTVKDKGRKDPLHHIQENFTAPEIEQLRRNVTIGLLPHLPKLMQIRDRLSKELPVRTKNIAYVSNRFLDGIVTGLAVYELLGFNAEDLYMEILAKYKERLEVIHGAKNKSELLNACLYAPRISYQNQDNVMTRASVRDLITGESANVLNNSGCGIYYLHEYKWIIIRWRQVQQAILNYHYTYAGISEALLRNEASSSAYVLSEVGKDKHQKIMTKLRLKIPDVKSEQEYTVLRYEYLIESEKAIKTFAEEIGNEESNRGSDGNSERGDGRDMPADRWIDGASEGPAYDSGDVETNPEPSGGDISSDTGCAAGVKPVTVASTMLEESFEIK